MLSLQLLAAIKDTFAKQSSTPQQKRFSLSNFIAVKQKRNLPGSEGWRGAESTGFRRRHCGYASLELADYSEDDMRGVQYNFFSFGAGRSPGSPNWRAENLVSRNRQWQSQG